MYWNLPLVKSLFNELLPYSQAIGGAAVAALVLLYKDLKSYKHPIAAVAVLGTVLLFSGLNALNTYNERHERARENKTTTGTISAPGWES